MQQDTAVQLNPKMRQAFCQQELSRGADQSAKELQTRV